MVENKILGNSIKRVIFIFLASYSVLYIFPYPLNWIVKIVGKYFFNIINLENSMTGSGDTFFQYIRLLLIFLFSIFFSLIIFFVDRKRKNYSDLYYWLYAIIRYYLALMMLLYGFSKVFKSQFPFPSILKLEEPLGNASPMGLLWTFMGYSTSYTFFSGFAEIIGGMLLLFKKTTTLGSLILVIVMLNVTMINFSYDVPVKIFSIHLLFFSLLLLFPNIINLYHFFILNNSSSLYSFPLPTILLNHRKGYFILKSLIIFSMIISTCYLGIVQMKEYGDSSTKPFLYGVYNAQKFILNNDTLLPLSTDTIRWEKLIIGQQNSRIILMNGKIKDFKIEPDSNQNKMVFIPLQNKEDKKILKYYYVNNVLIINGRWDNDSVIIKLLKSDGNNYPLLKREFHWINEYPFNQ